MGPNRQTDALRQVRRRRNRILAAAFFIFIALIIMLESPITRVRQMVVFGNRSIPAAQIIQAASLRKGMSLWQVSPPHVNRLVRNAEPLIQNVSVKTDYLHGVVELTVVQKHVVADLDVSGKFYPLLNDGDVFGMAQVAQGFDFPIITSSQVLAVNNGKQTSDPNVSLLCQQLDKLSPNDLSQMSELHVDPFGTITVYMNNGFEIVCKGQDFRSQIRTGLVAAQYFVSKGYAPGVVDITGQPPYQYTPLTQTGKAGHG